MKVVVLGSGSKGNSTLVELKNTKILIDVGFSYNQIKQKLLEVNLTPKDIDYVFITHDHVDHISGLRVYLNNNNPKLFVSKKIVLANPYLKNYNNLLLIEDEPKFDNFEVIVIPASHDATDNKGFIITEEESLVYLTDTGYINQRNFKVLSNREYYIFESNHDVEMLRKSSKPVHLQNRILSATGHLSNKDAAIYLSKIIGPKTKKIVLAHLSEENNSEEVALKTFKEINTFTNVICAKQREVVKVND